MIAQFTNARAAKNFLVAKVVAEAQREGVPLTDAERKMMYFSAVEPTIENDVADQFPEYDPRYEEKIKNLLRAAYEKDREERSSFKAALQELKKGDHYLVIMADGAFKPAPGSFKDQVRLLFWALVVVAGMVLWGIYWQPLKEAFWHWWAH